MEQEKSNDENGLPGMPAFFRIVCRYRTQQTLSVTVIAFLPAGARITAACSDSRRISARALMTTGSPIGISASRTVLATSVVASRCYGMQCNSLVVLWSHQQLNQLASTMRMRCTTTAVVSGYGFLTKSAWITEVAIA